MTPQSVLDSNRNGDAAGDRTIVNLSGVSGTGSGVYAINALGQRIVDGGGADVLGDPSTVGYVAINGSAQYIQAGPGARANAGRNTLRTNSWNRTDMTLVKNFASGRTDTISSLPRRLAISLTKGFAPLVILVHRSL